MRPETRLRAMYRCECGGEHEATHRISNMPVVRCPELSNDGLMHFYPDLPVPVIAVGERVE